MPDSQCVSHYFPSLESATAYYERQRDLSANRDDRLMIIVEQERKFQDGKHQTPTGRWEVRMWYGPYYVWVKTAEYEGLGEADYRENGSYLVRLEYPRNQEVITVPIAQTTRLKDFVAQKRAAREKIPLQISRRFVDYQ